MAVIRRIRGSVAPSAHAFIEQAEQQLERARASAAEGRLDEATVFAYRDGLRAAGAVIAFRRGGRKRLPAGSAWVRLRSLSPDLKGWTDGFEVHARLASRSDMGLERNVELEKYAKVYADSCDFVDLARSIVGYGQQAA